MSDMGKGLGGVLDSTVLVAALGLGGYIVYKQVSKPGKKDTSGSISGSKSEEPAVEVAPAAENSKEATAPAT